MGAPKQKWTAEEEAALKAGVLKHGTGKWRTILMDPDFSAVLRLRSNVDLKDKWRNINVTAIWGSRQKAKLALKRSPLTPKREENGKALSVVVQSNEEVVDAKPLAMASGTPRNGGPKDLLARLDNLILEAITTLKEPSGSDRASIALYIQVHGLMSLSCKAAIVEFQNENKSLLLDIEKYWAPMNLRKLLGGKLKHLTANGKLIKVKHKYMIASSSTVSEGRRNHTLPEGKQKEMLKLEKSKNKILTKAQVDQDLLKIRGMTASEAAAAAAAAVAEAETAIAEAEAAAREAEKAEAEAEAAQVFAKAAIKAFKHRACHPCIITIFLST
ncbi:telomere repeat-binding factor 2 isoform X2 [Populus alba]